MNKKGFIFTFISVTLASVIILAFLIQYTSRTRVDIERTNTEVETINSFVKSLNNDYFPRALKVSGNQAFISLLYYMDSHRGGESGGYIPSPGNPEHYFVNAIVDGRYKEGWDQEGEPLVLMEIDDINYNLSFTLNELVNLANYTNIDLELSDITTPQSKQDMMVFQDNPWYVNISMIISYTISSKDGNIFWEYEDKEIKTSIPIKNFIDPVHMMENDPGTVNVTILETIYESAEDIEDHVLYTSFVACDRAPSFLGRMNASWGASPVGIESLYDVRDSGKSAIDYQYYPNLADPTGALVQIGDSGYYIDGDHQGCHEVYNPP